MLVVDAVTAAVTVAFSVLLALALAEYQRALVRRTRAGAHKTQLAASALAALRAEELRVRRAVAEGLHGTVQQQLVLLAAELAQAGQSLAADDPRQAEVAQRIARVRSRLDQMREHDIRDMSRLLYPSGLDVGLAQAVRIFVRQLPPGVAVAARIDDSVIVADDPELGGIGMDRRLLALRVLEEAVSNAVRHGHAQVLEISLRVEAGVLNLSVVDDGAGISVPSGPGDRAGSGLRLLHESLCEFGGTLSLSPGTAGGTRLAALLPLQAASTAASAAG
jgi:signal transduction histidine kinase